MTGKVQEPNEQSQQTVRLNIREQALLLQFHPNQNLNRHPNAFLSKIVHLDPSDFHFFFISRPPTFNPEDYPIRAFIPYRFRPKDHQLCEFRSTFADR